MMSVDESCRLRHLTESIDSLNSRVRDMRIDIAAIARALGVLTVADERPLSSVQLQLLAREVIEISDALGHPESMGAYRV